MIDIDDAYLKAYLRDIGIRVSYAAEVLDWAMGEQTLNAAELVPPMNTDEGKAAWKRYTRQVQGFGPRALRVKRSGTLGDVGWGGDNPGDIDEKLSEIDLRGLARPLFLSLFAHGCAALWAYVDEKTNEPKLQRLGGYLEPLYPADDPGGEVVGLYQVTAAPGLTVRYTIRIYDFEEKSIRRWTNRNQAYGLGSRPDAEWKNTSMPRLKLIAADQSGLPVGELAQVLPIFKADIAQQLRVLRVAETQAFSQFWMAGSWDDPKRIGPNNVFKSPDASSTMGRIEPGSLAELFALHDRTLERIRSDLSLPIAAISGADFPSGEALSQANAAFISSCSDYARVLSSLMTEVVADYAELSGVSRDDAPPVNININRENVRAAISNEVRLDYKFSIISLRAAVSAISEFYPNWADNKVEEFLSGNQPSQPDGQGAQE